MPLIARFVDSIAASPGVRLDVNDGVLWRLQAESRLDPPPPKRARVSTLLADGAVYPAAAYDDRVLELRWYLATSDSDDAAEQVQLLGRQLDRPGGNIFQYQTPGATHPVFFRTQRLGLGAINMFTDGTQHIVEASVPAEPFAYGLPQTLSSVTVNNNPAAGSNGMFFDVSGILGDVETPLVLRINHADTDESWGRQSVFAIRRSGDDPSLTPFFLQAESMTPGTNTTVQANDAVMSGAGSNYSRCTFTTATMQTRLSTNSHPSSSGINARGRYRVYLRYRKSVSGDTITVRLQWGDSNQPFTNSTVTLPSGTGRRYVDLGDVQIPFGVDAPTKLDGSARSVLGIYLAVQAARSGSGNLDMDVILLVPADDRFCLVNWYAFAGPDYAWLDGVNDAVYHTTTAGVTSARGPSTATAGMPLVTPGITNRVFVVGDVNPSATNDDIANTMTIVASYLPRYLYIRGPST